MGKSKTIELSPEQVQILEKFLQEVQNKKVSIEPTMNRIQDSINQMGNSVQKALGNLSEEIAILTNFTAILTRAVKNINLPSISEESKNQMLYSYKKWGETGWTPPPNADINLFYQPPLDLKSSNKIIRKITNQEEMEYLFNRLSNVNKLRKSDLNEAINCFRCKNYKACGLILFSLIDAKLIRMQIKSDLNGRGYRATGKRAGINLFEKAESKVIDENMFFLTLRCINLVNALSVLFENGNDFKIQPKVINRNYLCHGMFHRRVTRKDCVMLFLFIYNFITFFECINLGVKTN